MYLCMYVCACVCMYACIMYICLTFVCMCVCMHVSGASSPGVLDVWPTLYINSSPTYVYKHKIYLFRPAVICLL